MAGLNTEIVHKECRFHVQTQDMGAGANYVESIIYKLGKVLSSRRSFYTTFLSSPDLKQKIEQLIQEQHETVLKEISEGKFDHL